MGVDCCRSEQTTVNAASNLSTVCEMNEREELANPGAKSLLILEPPAFRTHQSLDRGKIPELPRVKGKSARKLQVQQKDIMTASMRRQRRPLAERTSELKLGQTADLIIRIPDTPEEIKAPQIASVGLFPRPSLHLKIEPCHFRVEKPGNIEDRYQMLGVIGKGGYGEVRKVRNRLTNEIRAVKVIAKSKCQMTESFSDEIRILQHLVMQHYNNWM